MRLSHSEQIARLKGFLLGEAAEADPKLDAYTIGWVVQTLSTARNLAFDAPKYVGVCVSRSPSQYEVGDVLDLYPQADGWNISPDDYLSILENGECVAIYPRDRWARVWNNDATKESEKSE